MEYPAFVEDQVYRDMDTTLPEIDQLKAMLSNLTRVHLLTANKFDSFDDLMHEYLVSGIEVFGLETGIVSEVTENGVYRICDVVSPIELLCKGQEFALEDTYCREVIKSQRVIGFPEVGKLDYMNCHPVYQNLKLEAYLSAPIYVGEKLFGTFNFTSTAPRKNGFSQHEHNLIMLMANSIGSFVLLRNKTNRLRELNESIKRLVGYVAHDLRNPIGTIIGYAKMGEKTTVSDERLREIIKKIRKPAEQALEFVSTILENSAITTGKFSLNLEPVALENLLREAVDSVELLASEVGIRIEQKSPAGVFVQCDAKRLNQSLMNLLINAIKYSPPESLIVVNSSVEDGHCQLSITNEIAHTKDNVGSQSRKIYGSVGFGLEIVKAVLSAHGSELRVTDTEGMFRAEFSLAKVS
ncbi:GAF domain-containing sensor histidine kinase [Teredinibacter haidensis]|uniref:GAF domain-containing sensor histidine kinase n=1 Tax=Teredinibacter haidensis TaxID=2731755 RepID=UPI00094907FD|nr:GAF domain-containing sensor histidine kinase [Teredinibacter haidensis]